MNEIIKKPETDAFLITLRPDVPQLPHVAWLPQRINYHHPIDLLTLSGKKIGLFAP